MESMLWDLLVGETALVEPDEPCYCCVVYHDKEYREEDVDVEAQKSVKGRYPDTEHVRFRTRPEVTAATAACKGAYDQLNEAMTAVAQWVTDNDYVFDGPVFNIDHVSSHETDNPDKYVTEVCYPVRRRA